MRIRSLKPEFWSSEDMAAVSDFSKLIAIGLISMADDDGYFNANESLIENTLFPIKPPTESISESLTELLNVEFIELFSECKGRRYGRVCNFTKHQRINRPSPSKIAPLVGKAAPKTLTDRRSESLSESFREELTESLTEDSPQEQGAGSREQGAGIPPVVPQEGDHSEGDEPHRILKGRPELSGLTWEQDQRARQAWAGHPGFGRMDKLRWLEFATWAAGEALLMGNIDRPGAWLRRKVGDFLDGRLNLQKKEKASAVVEVGERLPVFKGVSGDDE